MRVGNQLIVQLHLLRIWCAPFEHEINYRRMSWHGKLEILHTRSNRLPFIRRCGAVGCRSRVALEINVCGAHQVCNIPRYHSAFVVIALVVMLVKQKKFLHEATGWLRKTSRPTLRLEIEHQVEDLFNKLSLQVHSLKIEFIVKRWSLLLFYFFTRSYIKFRTNPYNEKLQSMRWTQSDLQHGRKLKSCKARVKITLCFSSLQKRFILLQVHFLYLPKDSLIQLRFMKAEIRLFYSSVAINQPLAETLDE